MKLTQLTAKPQLVKITLDDEEIIKTYGEPVEFWMWDRQPLNNYVRLAQIKPDNVEEMIKIASEMVLDESGQPVFADESTLPNMILTRVIARVVETLGK